MLKRPIPTPPTIETYKPRSLMSVNDLSPSTKLEYSSVSYDLSNMDSNSYTKSHSLDQSPLSSVSLNMDLVPTQVNLQPPLAKVSYPPKQQYLNPSNKDKKVIFTLKQLSHLICQKLRVMILYRNF